MTSTALDYSSHFWGEKHIGYHVLYENLKRGEDTIQEFSVFVKERMGVEDDLLKFLHKNINRVNNFVASGGPLADSWRLTKATLELWAEIQTSLLKNLADLSKDVVRYHDELVKSRKRAREYDVLDAVNLMQTTTTCLQKAKETYYQRLAEAMNLKNEASGAKEFLKAKNKLTKAHDEYRAYVDKYNQVRGTFEERMLKSTRVFQEQHGLHLHQIRNFFVAYACALDASHSAVSQMLSDYRRTLEGIDITEIMRRFILEKSTGTERPQPIVWTDTDEIPAELEAYAAGLTAGGGPQSAQISQQQQQQQSTLQPLTQSSDPQVVNDLLAGFGGGGGDSTAWTSSTSTAVSRRTIASESKSADISDSDEDTGVDLGGALANATTAAVSGAYSYVPQFSSWLGRQKLTQWRKKHSASQSNLPAATTANANAASAAMATETVDLFSTLANNTTTTITSSANNNDSGLGGMSADGSVLQKSGNFLKRRHRKSINDLTLFNETTVFDHKKVSVDNLKSDDTTPKTFATSVPNSVDIFGFAAGGVPPAIPSSGPPPASSSYINSRRSIIADEPFASGQIASIADGIGGDNRGAAGGATDVDMSLFGGTGIDWSSTNIQSTIDDNPPNRRHKSRDSWAKLAVGDDQTTACSSSSSSSSDEDEFQASKLRTLQIKPLDATSTSSEKMNASVDELRNVVKHMTLQRSTTFDKDPWTSEMSLTGPAGGFSHSLGGMAAPTIQPLRAALTGDEHLRRKFSEMDSGIFPPNAGGIGGTGAGFFAAGSGIARPRMRSHTPTAAQLMQIQGGGGGGVGAMAKMPPRDGISLNPFNVNQKSDASAEFGNAFSSAAAATAAATTAAWFSTPAGGSSGGGDSLSSVFDAARGASTSSPLLAFGAPQTSATTAGAAMANGRPAPLQQKLPVAMALNEYVHARFTRDNFAPVIRVFGTVMISLPTSILSFLADVNSFEVAPLRFSMRNANHIKSILPNKRLIEATSSLESNAGVYSFKMERQTLAQWLAGQQSAKPSATFHNVDIVRYELDESADAPPLRLAAYWRREPTHADLRVDYVLNTVSGLCAENPLLNIQFSTIVDGRVEAVQSAPDAKWNADTRTLTWTLTELSRHGDCAGSLKARLRLADGSPPSQPANTNVQFQIADASASGVTLTLGDPPTASSTTSSAYSSSASASTTSASDYALSMVRRKIFAGKYFCEPQIC